MERNQAGRGDGRKLGGKEQRRNAGWRRNEGEVSNKKRRMKMNQMRRTDGEIFARTERYKGSK
jgi:hypothetical protein